MAWQLQEAKQRFSEVVRRAQEEGDQVVTRNGRPTVVVVDFERYRRGRGSDRDVLLHGPKLTEEEWQIAFGPETRGELFNHDRDWFDRRDREAY